MNGSLLRLWLVSSRRSNLSYLVLGLAALAMIAAVATLVVVHGVMTGFGGQMTRQWQGFAGTSRAHGFLDAEAWKETAAKNSANYMAVLEGSLFIPIEQGHYSHVLVKAVDLDKFRERATREGLKLYDMSAENNEGGAWLGAGLWAKWQPDPSVRSINEVTIIHPLADVSPTGEWLPRQRSLPLAGIIETGLTELDESLVVVPLEVGQYLWREDVKVAYLESMSQSSPPVDEAKSLRWQSWESMNPRLAQALAMEQWGFRMVLMLTLGLSALGLACFIYLWLRTQNRALGLFVCFGMTPRSLLWGLVSLGGCLTGVCASCGVICGSAVLYLLWNFPLPMGEGFQAEVVLVRWDPVFWVMLIGGCILWGALLTFPASRRAITQAMAQIGEWS